MSENAQGGSTLVWVAQYQGLALATATVLTLLYMFPVILVTLAAIATEGFKEPSGVFEWFAAFMKTADTTLSEYHKILFPVISAISVVVFRDKPNWKFIAFGGFVLTCFVLTVWISVLFDMPSIQNAIDGLPNKPDMTVVKSFFTRVQETLLMYLMMLLGLGVVNGGLMKAGE